MSKKLFSILTIGFLGVLLLSQSVFTVHQTQRALILQLGKPLGESLAPGLHFKMPFIQNVLYFDARIINYDASTVEAITKDKKVIILDNYAKWRIINPLVFYQNLRTIPNAQESLKQIIQSEQLAVVGTYDLSQVVGGTRHKQESTEQGGAAAEQTAAEAPAGEQTAEQAAERKQHEADQKVIQDQMFAQDEITRLYESGTRQEIMDKVKRQANEKTQKLGVEVVDVRIKRTDLPEENQRAIFSRMTAERERQAMEYRSEGEKDATIIRAEVDRTVTVTLAEARKQSEILRGEGEAEATRIFAEAISQSPEFYEFSRSLEAYKKSLGGNTRFILNPDDAFFRFLRQRQ